MTIAQYIYIAIAIILAAAGVTGVIWWHNDIERSCETRVQAADQSQVIKQLQTNSAQKDKDLQDAVTAVEQLEADKRQLAAALSTARTSISVLRLCGTAHSPSPLPGASSGPPISQPTDSGSSGVGGVPSGDQPGIAGATELQDIAFAGAIAASAYRSTYQWANAQSQVNPSH